MRHVLEVDMATVLMDSLRLCLPAQDQARKINQPLYSSALSRLQTPKKALRGKENMLQDVGAEQCGILCKMIKICGILVWTCQRIRKRYSLLG